MAREKPPGTVEVIDASEVPSSVALLPPGRADALTALVGRWRGEADRLRSGALKLGRGDLFDMAASLVGGAAAAVRADALDDAADDVVALLTEWQRGR